MGLITVIMQLPTDLTNQRIDFYSFVALELTKKTVIGQAR